MIEGSYKSRKFVHLVLDFLLSYELIGLIGGFMTGCYYLVQIGFAYFLVGAWLKLAGLITVFVAMTLAFLFVGFRLRK